jgi:hypothetical protein
LSVTKDATASGCVACHCRQPRFAAIELALACDLRFCSPNAEFALQDAKWGFHACDGGLVRLPQIVGLGHAMEIVLSGERVDAEHAYRIGLVNQVWPQAELLARTMDYAQRPAPRSIHDVGLTEDLAEGTAAFRERREAVFRGR